MSQLISDFIIEPVARQARRLSGRDSIDTTSLTTPNAPNEFPEYVDPIAEDDAKRREEEGMEDLTDRLRIFPQSQQPQDVTDLATGESRDRAETDPEAFRRTQQPEVISRDRFVSINASFPSTSNAAGLRFMEDSTMSTTSSATRTSGGAPAVDSMLPEDDGMRIMRKRILEVHSANISNDEKSRMIHDIMLEQYVTSGATGARAHSPSSLRSYERPISPVSRGSIDLVQTESPGTSASLAVEELSVTAEDIKPTYWIPPPPPPDATPEQSRKNSIDENREFGCEHYKRNVKLQCSACSKWYTCRFCHDQVEDHCLNRQATKNMLCMYCGTAQPAAGECRSCGFCAAHYYCKLCKLWDDDSTKAIYHCDSCGICRRGEGLGKDFFHCQKCSACIAIKLLDNHKCVERSTDCDCPICGEYMFTSPKTVVFMRCGHSIHYDCWTQHMKSSYKCPICSKSMVNMDLTFRQYDNDIEVQPMPPRFKDTKAWIFCNDCTNKSLVPFHWVGLKCSKCDSYNTARLQIISAPEDVDLGAPENDQPVPRIPIISGQAAPEIIATPVILPSIVSPTDLQTRERLASSSVAVPVPINEPEITDTGDDEDDEVDFWGGTSPRERAMLEERLRAEQAIESDSEASTSEEEFDLMDDEEEEDDQMAIFGHR